MYAVISDYIYIIQSEFIILITISVHEWFTRQCHEFVLITPQIRLYSRNESEKFIDKQKRGHLDVFPS